MRGEIVGVCRRPGSGAHRGIPRSAGQVDRLNLAGTTGPTKLVEPMDPEPADIRRFADEITGTMQDWNYDTMTPM